MAVRSEMLLALLHQIDFPMRRIRHSFAFRLLRSEEKLLCVHQQGRHVAWLP